MRLSTGCNDLSDAYDPDITHKGSLWEIMDHGGDRAQEYRKAVVRDIVL